ncbi:hypothetical protein ACFVH0_12855 [Streptomyces sp. NPDC127117]|uniref:effector-associated constant component EACC1 n=1 Tax=Streptomyces sp. NPDC127117 TaxID=3345368 RepID=UPI00362E6F85
MSTIHAGPVGYRLSIVDEDPLRSRREARELLAAITDTDPHAALDVPRPQDPGTDDSLKGGPATDLIGLVFGGGSLAAAAVQIWLARVPQRTIVVTRPDGATLRISGKEARVDDERIQRFLTDGSEDLHGDGPTAE